ncbi:MAG: CBS domain-containing protein [Armatimonadetes bacterium]|nr:CBS domain-containing protein [Armatimonadota bacterium]
MKDSGVSQSPRRLLGISLVALAAASLYLGGPTTAVWPEGPRAACLFSIALLLLVVHALLSPATLSYALMLDLRRRGRGWLDPGRRRFAELHERTRWIDLVLPFLLSLLLFVAAWLTVQGLAVLVPRQAVAWASLALVLLWPALGLAAAGWLLRGRGERVERLTDDLVAGAVALLRPLLVPLAWLGERLLASRLDEPAEALPEQDLADVIEVGSHQGDLSIAQSELLRRELDFARKTAADVMVPRVAVQYLDISWSIAETKQRITSSRFSRFPVQEGSVDHVVAVLHAKQLLRYPNGGAPESLRKLLTLLRPRPPLHVRFDDPLEDVLERLRRENSSLAIVDDVYGGVAGILTVEDVVEEIVGEIVDESDAERVSHSFVCSGRRRLSELAAQGIELPGDPELTVAEFLTEEFGTVIHAGQAWASGGRRLVIEATDADGRIEVVRAELDLPHRQLLGER